VNLPVRLNLSPYVSVERLPATGVSPVAGEPAPQTNWFTTLGDIYQAGKIESAYIPMSLRLGPTVNVFLPLRLSPPICRRGCLTDYQVIRSG
jgi:hypothetical protein